MPCRGWLVHSPLLAHQVQRVDLEDLPAGRSCDVWMWCLYLMLCFPTGEILVSGKDGGFQTVSFVFGLGQQDISITEGVTDLGAVSTIKHRYRLMEKRRHIRTCRRTQPTFRHETSHCISQSKVGSIFFHDGLDRSQNIVPTHGDPHVGRQIVTRPLKVFDISKKTHELFIPKPAHVHFGFWTYLPVKLEKV